MKKFEKFNNGNAYHGSSSVDSGKLRGSTVGSDYFYFFCPKCSEDHILRVLEYGVYEESEVNPSNDDCKSKAKYGFTLAFKIYCEKCGFKDFVKLSNTGYQTGSAAQFNF